MGHGKFGEGVVDTASNIDECGLLMDRFNLESLDGALPADIVLADLAFNVRGQITPPRHSGFRVICLLVYRHAGKLAVEVGFNCEVVSLTGGVCAEKNAVTKLVTKFSGKTPLDTVERVVIVSDADHVILPGLNCREFLMEHLPPSVRVVAAWHDSTSPPRPAGIPGPGRPHMRTAALQDIYPHANAYRRVARADVAAFAEQLAARCAPVPAEPSATKRLFEATLKRAQDHKETDEKQLHPVYYAAGALFQSGEVRVCTSAVAIEYPCSIDAVARLSVWLEEHVQNGDHPTTVVVCDQWGVLHAPFATGRSYLCEYGFDDVTILIHDADSGAICTLRCRELAGGDDDSVHIDCLGTGKAES